MGGISAIRAQVPQVRRWRLERAMDQSPMRILAVLVGGASALGGCGYSTPGYSDRFAGLARSDTQFVSAPTGCAVSLTYDNFVLTRKTPAGGQRLHAGRMFELVGARGK